MSRLRSILPCVLLAALAFAANAAPAPAAGASRVTVASKNGAWPKTSVPDFGTLKSVLAFRSSSIGVASVTICLANFAVAAQSASDLYRVKPAPGQAMVVVTLVHQVSGVRDVPFVKGRYDFAKVQGQAPMTGSTQIRVTGGSSISFSEPVGGFEVTAFTGTRIEGRFQIKDKWSEVAGEVATGVR